MGVGRRHRRSWLLLLCLVPMLLIGPGGLPVAAAETQKTPAAGTDLVIVERDVPQTRNFEPVINHEAMLVNVSAKTISVDILSPIPEGFVKNGKFFPAFAHDSLLGEPLLSPYQVAVSKYEILEKPRLSSVDGRQCYAWSGVKIKPGEAVIAQYDNYYGPVSQFSTGTGVRFSDLEVGTEYKYRTTGRTLSLKLAYTLKNTGRKPWKGIFFGSFLPDTIAGPQTEQVLLRVIKGTASAGAKLDRSAISDGRMRMAQGSDFTLMLDSLAPGKALSYSYDVAGAMENPGGLYPLLTIQARSEGARLWPATIMRSSAKLKTEIFYYRHLSLVIPDPRYFMIGKDWRVKMEGGG